MLFISFYIPDTIGTSCAPFLYVYFVMPSQFMQFGHIGQFAHGPVRFLRIECNAAFISRFLYYQMRQAGDGYFFSRADVDVAVAYLFFVPGR